MQSIFIEIQERSLCGRGPSSELTPTASAASLGYAGLQAARRNTRFARYCEENTLADAFILTITTCYFYSKKITLKRLVIVFFEERLLEHPFY